MKRLLLLVASTLVLTTTPSIAAPPALAAPDDVQFCRQEVLPNVPQATLGECVSYSQTFLNSPNGFFAHDCDAFLEIDPDLFSLFFDSYSDCIRTTRQN